MLIVCNGIQIAFNRASAEQDQAVILETVCKELSFGVENCCVEKTDLGKPQFIGSGEMPALSFCYSMKTRWAAVAWTQGLGIDIACPYEFEQPYPVERVFGEREILLIQQLDVEQLSSYAMLWCLKEAAVKAMGTGFHTVEPNELFVSGIEKNRDIFEAEIATPVGDLKAVLMAVESCWLAFAVLQDRVRKFDV